MEYLYLYLSILGKKRNVLVLKYRYIVTVLGKMTLSSQGHVVCIDNSQSLFFGLHLINNHLFVVGQ